MYKELDRKKFEFVKSLYNERVRGGKRANDIYRHINAKCASLRSKSTNKDQL